MGTGHQGSSQGPDPSSLQTPKRKTYGCEHSRAILIPSSAFLEKALKNCKEKKRINAEHSHLMEYPCVLLTALLCTAPA